MYDNITDYESNNLLIREQAAKLFYQSAVTLGYDGMTYSNCSFSDIDNVDDSLKENIMNICTM
jgi:hypothetical protein